MFQPPHCELCGEKAEEYIRTRYGLSICWECGSGDERSEASTKLGVKAVSRPWPGMSNRERNSQYARDYKSETGCADCPEDRPAVLEFDHIPGRGKSATVSALVYRGVPLSILKKEMDRCEVVCANCHKLRTDARRVHSSVQV